GNRLGYSRFRNIRATSPAPAFIDIDGQGTPNNITPFSFTDRCMFFASAADFTVLKIKDEGVENVTFDNCTLVGQSTAELCVVDTTDTPLTTSIGSLVVRSCELEINGTVGARRMFKLSNVGNFAFDNNDVTGGGQAVYLGELYNSHLISCSGNSYRSFVGELFNGDATSTFRSGKNTRNVTNSSGEFHGNGYVSVPFSATMTIDGSSQGQDKHAIFRIDVSAATPYAIRVLTARPYAILSGQVFTVEIRNVTGGGISAPSFTTNFKVGSGLTAPAAGMSRTVTFYFDGTNAREISRSAVDVPIA
ncbi:hypothetical protein N5D41_22930, partial [Pseudomonas toyotomiensis]